MASSIEKDLLRRVSGLEEKIENLPEALVKRLDDRYLTKNQWWHVLAAVGLIVIGGLADRLWQLVVHAASQ